MIYLFRHPGVRYYLKGVGWNVSGGGQVFKKTFSRFEPVVNRSHTQRRTVFCNQGSQFIFVPDTILNADVREGNLFTFKPCEHPAGVFM
jgi:hypothetical protein